MNNLRDYNNELKDNEGRKYNYNFDIHVMHHYMLKSMLPFFREGELLELGSSMGIFTERLLPFFSKITCVEASLDAINIAKKRFIKQDNISYKHSLFENLQIEKKYNNIIMTHVLEHVNDPVAVLRQINQEWLSDNGRFLLICPNANAPSRQIAVKMGLISHNSAITESERKHGHQNTYSFDTLERDVRSAGFNVTYRTGIFFKALANFQWDQILETDIVSKEYLEGCYMLGQQYPELCASIFLVCEKNI